jgi:hypothetical protein
MLGTILFAAQLALSPCKPRGLQETLQCGKLTVFEDRVARSGSLRCFAVVAAQHEVTG